MYNEKEAQEESGKRHQVLISQCMRQPLFYRTGALSLLVDQSTIWVMYRAIHKGHAGLEVIITVAHLRHPLVCN